MNIKEFDYLAIHTPSGWRQGQATSLAVDDKGRLSLGSWQPVPLKYKEEDEVKEIDPAHMAFDRKNFLYLIEKNSCRLFRYSRKAKEFQPVGCKEAGPCAHPAGHVYSFMEEIKHIKCSRIAFSASALYVLDTENGFLHSFSYPGFQFRFSIGGEKIQNSGYCAEEPVTLKKPNEILIDNKGNLFILDAGNRRILLINPNGYLLKTIAFDSKDPCQPQQPLAMAMAPDGCLYILEAGNVSALNSIQKWDKNQNKWIKIADFLVCDKSLQSFSIAVDKNGVISVGGHTDHILQFTEAGKYLGLTEVEDPCHQLATDQNGELYGLFGDKKQIVHFGSDGQYAVKGSYLSKTLDSKTEQCQWHRLLLGITIPEKTQFLVQYFASDDKINPEEIEAEAWRSFVNSSNNQIKDALFENAVGRYLVLKFEFISDGQNSPALTMARIYFQRNSYLRFLPAVYQEDEKGKDFLERFLSLYESMSLDVEEKITHVTKYFDIDASEKEFLDWLGSWLAVTVDENWPELKKRVLLKEAFELYKSRGTTKTLRRMIEIFTGAEVAIIEHWRLRPPMVLHPNLSILGVNSFVGPKRTQRLIVEEYSRIGEFILEENEDAPETPFLVDAYDFTVLIDTSTLEGEYEKTLRRLIEDEKPAHTRYFLRSTQGAIGQLGKQSLLGVNTVLGDEMKPMHIGKNAHLGETTVVGTHYPVQGTIGARSKISVDAILH